MPLPKRQEREKKMGRFKNSKKEIEKNMDFGITLIALVITVIVLLILAGISISMLSRR